jgi:hypothetical protein
MKIEPIFIGEVTNGKMQISESERINMAKYIQTLKNGRIWIKLAPYNKRRTIDQNKLYWVWLTLLEEETGQPKEDIHAYFKKQFLSRVATINGKKETLIGSTTELSTKEFTEYLEKVANMAALPMEDGGFNCVLPINYQAR